MAGFGVITEAVMHRGLLYGLNSLTETELADFFSEVCLCGRVHSLDSLKKLRAEIVRLYNAHAPGWRRIAYRAE